MLRSSRPSPHSWAVMAPWVAGHSGCIYLSSSACSDGAVYCSVHGGGGDGDDCGGGGDDDGVAWLETAARCLFEYCYWLACHVGTHASGDDGGLDACGVTAALMLLEFVRRTGVRGMGNMMTQHWFGTLSLAIDCVSPCCLADVLVPVH